MAISLAERLFEYAELVAHKAELDAADLVLQLRDGRAIVRANAALALAVVGHTGPDLVPFLRDGDVQVALAAGDALAKLGMAQREHLVRIAGALEGARPEVVAAVEKMFAELVGKADVDLANVLDTGSGVIAGAVVRACEKVGARGLALLQQASRDGRARVRINAVRGIAELGELEQESSMQALTAVERGDEVSDARAAARAALGRLSARCRQIVSVRQKTSAPPPASVPELELRELNPDELAAAAKIAPLDELLHALEDARVHARLNAVRVLGLQGGKAAASARALALLLRDPETTIRAEVASALGKLGAAAIDVAPALARSLDDVDPAVIAAAEATLATLGDAAAPALFDGLDTASEAHGARVAALIARLSDGAAALRRALTSSSVDVRVNAALGLGALGKARAGAVLPALAAAGGGNARVRSAVTKAIALLEPKPDHAPPSIAIAGFFERALTEDELGKAKAALAAAGAAGMALYLGDAWPAVRANAALALGILGGDALPLAVCLRDDDAAVRLAAARALERLGEPAVTAHAPDLVRALRDADATLATALAAMLRSRTGSAIDAALASALDGDDDVFGGRICELVCARPSAVEILCDALARPAAQVNAVRGLVMLGKDRIGRGRAALEAARTSSSPQLRELARAALRALDGAPAAPGVPPIAGFETAVLDAKSLTAANKVDPVHLVALLQDGRAVVRANAATALGGLGVAAAEYATSVGALVRDDDDRVKIAAARALDQLGDDAVATAAPYLVLGLRGEAAVADACQSVLAARKAKVEAALVAGLEASDETHGMRVAQLVAALPNARELLFAAFDGPAQNVQINAAFGIAMLGERAGTPGRQRLVAGLAGPMTRRRDAMVKALAMLGPGPAR